MLTMAESSSDDDFGCVYMENRASPPPSQLTWNLSVYMEKLTELARLTGLARLTEPAQQIPNLIIKT